MSRLHSAVLGATGVAGQQFIIELADHPMFEVTGLYASERSDGKRYADCGKWYLEQPIPGSIRDMKVRDSASIEPAQYDIIFSALPSEVARQIEGACASKRPVISTASAFRYEADVPIIMPEVNPSHFELIERQRNERGWEGFVMPGPNCTTVGLAVALAPLHQEFGLKRVFMTSLQALSGAGLPGVASLAITDNILPYIPKEEGKVQKETLKILGGLEGGAIADADFSISCICTRVPVIDGHTEAVFAETGQPCSPEQYKEAVRRFNERFRKEYSHLPSAPEESIVIMDEEDRPQPRLDRGRNGGMSVCVGRIHEDHSFRRGLSWTGLKFVLLSHNTKKGAAKGGILVAECLVDKGYMKRR